MRTLLTGMALLSVGQAHLLLGQSKSANCVAKQYKIVPLPLQPARINDSGEVAGKTDSGQAAVWTERSGLQKIRLPKGFRRAEAVSLNGAGDVVGLATDGDGGRRRAFLYAKGEVTLLPGEPSKAFAMDDTGVIAGESTVHGKAGTYPVLWQKQALVDLGACCGGFASAINQHGQVVGQTYDPQGRYHAFLWDRKSGLRMIGPPDEYSTAVAVNDSGYAAVQVLTQVFLYQEGKLTRLSLSRDSPSQAYAMNNCDVVVGSFGPNSDEQRAFLWERSAGFVDLNQRIQAGSGWTLEVATSINDKGEITGWGDHNRNDDSGFLLVPQW